MAKQLGPIKLIIIGTGDGPDSARFEYTVTHTDDTSLCKYAALVVDTPVFTAETLDDFYDGYVSVIESNESIS